MRWIAIVAMATKLLILLWRCVESGCCEWRRANTESMQRRINEIMRGRRRRARRPHLRSRRLAHDAGHHVRRPTSGAINNVGLLRPQLPAEIDQVMGAVLDFDLRRLL
jgi:hypothetical protein